MNTKTSSETDTHQQNLYNKSYVENSEFSVNMNSDYSYDLICYTFKVILLGDVGVGKTAIFERFVHSKNTEDYKSSININMDVKQFNIDANTSVEMEIFDTMGQERFKALTKNYIQGSKGIIILYSIVDKTSFKVLQTWIDIVKDVMSLKETTIFIVGNKLDREGDRTVTYEEAETFAKENHFSYYEVSAKLGMNVDIIFEKIAREMVKKAYEDGDQSQMTKIHTNSSLINLSKGFGGAPLKANSILGGKGKKNSNKKPYVPSQASCC